MHDRLHAFRLLIATLALEAIKLDGDQVVDQLAEIVGDLHALQIVGATAAIHRAEPLSDEQGHALRRLLEGAPEHFPPEIFTDDPFVFATETK